MTSKNLLKLIVSVSALVYFLYYATSTDTWHFIDGANLIIHEAGHWIFSFFGEFIYILGGSLNQVLVPSIFVAYFFINRQRYSGALCLFWVGQNLINVSVYAGDAVKMQLPLLGGENSIHDWNWLLLYTGQLHHTDIIAKIIYCAGLVTILTAGILAIIYSFKEDEKQISTD